MTTSSRSTATCIRRHGHQAAAAASGRILARLGGGARHRLARDPRPIRRTPRSRRGRISAARTAMRRPRAAELGAQVLDNWDAEPRDLQLPLRRAARLQRGHGARLPPRAERLDRQGMARPRSAPARLDHRADAERRIRGRRDRALRQGQALRAGHGAGDAGDAARAAPSLADLRGGRAARAADRHPCGLELPQPGDVARLAVALCRGLHQPGAGLSERR